MYIVYTNAYMCIVRIIHVLYMNAGKVYVCMYGRMDALIDQLCIFSTHASVIQNATGGTHTYLSDALSNILNKYLYY